MQTVNVMIPEGRDRVRHMDGHLNFPVEERYANIKSSITRGHQQLRARDINDFEVAVVGSGPSLASTFDELVEFKRGGGHVVALNGAYGFLLSRGLVPNALVLIDGREFNKRFITELIPTCHYFIASQCHPAIFDAVKGMPNIHIWHCLTGADKEELDILNGYYLGAWQPVLGGCTVGTRAMVLLRFLGYCKMHLFGMDSCYMDGEGHAMPQPENDGEGTQIITCAGKQFTCSAWMAEQALEFVDIIEAHGEHFQLEVHGNGLLAHILKEGAAGDQ